MTKRMLVWIVIIGSLSTSIWAQGAACTQYKTWWFSAGAGTGSEPDYSSWAAELAQLQAQYGGIGPTCSAQWEGVFGVWGGWSGECHSIAWTCAPPPPPVGGSPSTCTAGCPINLADGNTYIEQTDVRIPGLGNGLTLTRTWNSTWLSGFPQSGMFGTQWLSTYEEQVYVGLDGTMKYARSDGSIWSFAPYGNPLVYHLIAPANMQPATLTEQGTTSWTVTFQNGESRVFNNSGPVANNSNGGPLSAIVDRNGNTTTLTYGANGLTTVTDPAGRHLYFAHGTVPGYLVTGVTSDSGSGVNLTYTYALSYSSLGSFPLLTQVTQADNTFVAFTYNQFFLDITSVTDTNGKVLETHNYDSCHGGLSSSRANGVDALTISYSDAPSCNPGGAQ